MLSDLSCCRPRASCVVESSLADVWAVVRDWHRQYWITEVDNMPVIVSIVEGSGSAVGSIRSVQLGPSQMFEKLVALDDETHCLKWRLISHPDTVSPFPAASYVNFVTRMTLREVTHGNHAFVDWEGEFFTEHEFAAEMLSLFQRWFETGLKQLQVGHPADQGYSKALMARSQQQHSHTLGSQSRTVSPSPASQEGYAYLDSQHDARSQVPASAWGGLGQMLPPMGDAGYPVPYGFRDVNSGTIPNLQAWADLRDTDAHHGWRQR